MSKTALPVSYWDTVRHPTLVSQDTPSFPTLQHFFDKWTDGFLPEHLMDLRRRKSGFPDRLLPEAGFDGWHSWNQKPRFSPKLDLRLLGHLVSGFHMIHPKYALVSQQNHCWCNFHMDRRHDKKFLRMFDDYDHFNRRQPISDNEHPILWWIRAGQLRFEKLAQFSAVFSICRPNLVGRVGGWGADRSSWAPIKELNWWSWPCQMVKILKPIVTDFVA